MSTLDNTPLVWGKPEEYVVEFCKRVVVTFNTLPAAQPYEDVETQLQYLQEGEQRFLEEVLGKRGNWDAFDYFGQGHIAFTFDWCKSLPHFEIAIWSRGDDFVPSVPFDEPYRVWQSLIAKLVAEYGYDRNWLKQIIRFTNWVGEKKAIKPNTLLNAVEDLFDTSNWVMKTGHGWVIRNQGMFLTDHEKTDWMPIGDALYFSTLSDAVKAAPKGPLFIEASLYDLTTELAENDAWKQAHLIVSPDEMIPVAKVWVEMAIWPVRRFRLN